MPSWTVAAPSTVVVDANGSASAGEASATSRSYKLASGSSVQLADTEVAVAAPHLNPVGVGDEGTCAKTAVE